MAERWVREDNQEEEEEGEEGGADEADEADALRRGWSSSSPSPEVILTSGVMLARRLFEAGLYIRNSEGHRSRQPNEIWIARYSSAKELYGEIDRIRDTAGSCVSRRLTRSKTFPVAAIAAGENVACGRQVG